MSEIKRPWTPGPWWANRGGKWHRSSVSANSSITSEVTIASGIYFDDDATLISAAPELAEIAIRLINLRGAKIITPELLLLFDDAHSALRKAGMEGV